MNKGQSRFQEASGISVRSSIIVLTAIVITGVISRLVLSTGIQFTDSAIYSELAYSIAHPDYQNAPVAHHNLRYGLILPVALSYKLLGVNSLSLVLYPLTSSVVSILACYWIGTFLSSRAVGIVAACLLTFLPLSIYQATDLHADLPMSMGLALALCSFLYATRSEGFRRRRLFIAAGLFFGFAYFSKLTAIAFLPALLGLSFYYRRIREAKLAFITFLTLLCFETVTYAAMTGNWLYRIAAETSRGLHAQQVKLIYPDRASNLLSAFTEVPVLLLKPYPLIYQSYFGYSFLLLPIAVFWILKNRVREGYPLLLWMTLVYLPLSFAVLDFSTFAPAQIRVPRTLEPLCLPAMILIAQFLCSRQVLWRIVTLALLIPSSLFFSYVLHFDSSQEIEPIRRAYDMAMQVRGNEGAVFSDPFTAQVLRYFYRYRDKAVFVEFPNEPMEGLAILNPSAQQTIKKWLNTLPPEWVVSKVGWEQEFISYSQKRVVGGYRKRIVEKGLVGALFETAPDESRPITLLRLPKSSGLEDIKK